MPSASSIKLEKSSTAAAAEAVDNSPIRQVLVIVEHKIRNLEKRKVSKTLKQVGTQSNKTDRSFNTPRPPHRKIHIQAPVTHMHNISEVLTNWLSFVLFAVIIFVGIYQMNFEG